MAAVDLTEGVHVDTQAGCAWTAASEVAWIIVTTGATGNGSGDVRFTVGPNVGVSRRVGSLNVAGRRVTVTQAGLLGIQP